MYMYVLHLHMIEVRLVWYMYIHIHNTLYMYIYMYKSCTLYICTTPAHDLWLKCMYGYSGTYMYMYMYMYVCAGTCTCMCVQAHVHVYCMWVRPVTLTEAKFIEVDSEFHWNTRGPHTCESETVHVHVFGFNVVHVHHCDYTLCVASLAVHIHISATYEHVAHGIWIMQA